MISHMRPRLCALLHAEFLLAARQHSWIAGLLLFCLLLALILSLPLADDAFLRTLMAPHAVWVIAFFAAILQFNRCCDAERDEHVLEGFSLIADVAAPLFVAKFIVNLSMISIVTLGSAAFVGLFFSTNPLPDAQMWLALAAAIIALAAAGTPFALLLHRPAQRDLLLPVIFFPLMIPIAIALAGALNPQEAMMRSSWLQLLLAADVIYVLIGRVLFGTVLKQE